MKNKTPYTSPHDGQRLLQVAVHLSPREAKVLVRQWLTTAEDIVTYWDAGHFGTFESREHTHSCERVQALIASGLVSEAEVTAIYEEVRASRAAGRQALRDLDPSPPDDPDLEEWARGHLDLD